ncbi:MAG: peptidylprolyl isomerase [Armatimonadota bacterium]
MQEPQMPTGKKSPSPLTYTLIALAVIIIGTVIYITTSQGELTENDRGGGGMFPSGTTSTQVGNPPAAPERVTPSAPTKPATVSKPDGNAPTEAEVAAAKKAGTRHAIIKTSKGTMEAELYGKDAPLTVANFVKLANAHFYDGLTFHRVEPGFVIQGGDPDGNGRGGPGYSIKLEIAPKLRHVEGALAMARADDPDSAGSQFYVTLASTPSLDDNYAVFGKVVKGLDVSKEIAIGDKIEKVTIK